jgi:hypothetical protein
MTDVFAAASAVRPLGDGSFTVELSPGWTVGQRPHSGYLLALLARAATSVVQGDSDVSHDPLAVSAQFLRSPGIGAALLRTTVGSGAVGAFTAVRVTLEQSGRTCVEAMVTVGRFPEEAPAWADIPNQGVEPPPKAIDLAAVPAGESVRLFRMCDVRLDPQAAGFLHGRPGDPPRLRLWVRPRGADPDPLFALVAGDAFLPLMFNFGRVGSSPAVQLTALLRARPAPGWLRLQVESRAAHGPWFDEDATVVDSTGRLVCQARQLALSLPA